MQAMGMLQIVPNNYLPRIDRKQVRFPRSKKRRICKKWRLKDSSWKDTIPYVIAGHSIYIHPDNIRLLNL